MGYVFDALNKSRGDGEPDKDDKSFRLATGAVGDDSGDSAEQDQAPAAPPTNDQSFDSHSEQSSDKIQASNPELVDLTGDTIPDPTPPSAWAVAQNTTNQTTSDGTAAGTQASTDDSAESIDSQEQSLESALARAIDQANEIGNQVDDFAPHDPSDQDQSSTPAGPVDSPTPSQALDDLAGETETTDTDDQARPIAEMAQTVESSDYGDTDDIASEFSSEDEQANIEAGIELSDTEESIPPAGTGQAEQAASPGYVFTPLVAQRETATDYGDPDQPAEAGASGGGDFDPTAAADESEPQPGLRPIIPIAGLDDRLVALLNPASVMAEEYRAVRTRLLARWQHRRNLIHTITSAMPKEGKTLTSLNLCAIFSEMADRRVVVIECDLRIPMFRKMLKLPPSAGLIQVLRGEARLDEALSSTSRENLKVIAAGGVADDDATQMLSSPQFPATLAQLRHQFDLVIIDTPPVLELADAGIVGAQSDDVLLVVRMNRTPRHMIDEAINLLNGYQAPVTGAVLTDMHFTASSGGYGYRYGYRYSSRYSYKNRHGYRARRERMSA